MIFKYSPKKSGKEYTFKDLDAGEIFMVSDPREVRFEDCSVYIVVEDNEHAVDLETGNLLLVRSDTKVYPVICECSVRLYPDV